MGNTLFEPYHHLAVCLAPHQASAIAETSKFGEKCSHLLAPTLDPKSCNLWHGCMAPEPGTPLKCPAITTTWPHHKPKPICHISTSAWTSHKPTCRLVCVTSSLLELLALKHQCSKLPWCPMAMHEQDSSMGICNCLHNLS